MGRERSGAPVHIYRWMVLAHLRDTLVLVAVVGVLTALLLGACGGEDGPEDVAVETATPSETAASETASPSPEPEATQAVETAASETASPSPEPEATRQAATTPTPQATATATRQATPASGSLPEPRPDLVADCSEGVAVSNPEDNRGLVHDCAVLLEARDILTGDGVAPRWSADRPIGEWTGITVGGAPVRVTGILLQGQIAGRIPAGLGRLEELRSLDLQSGLGGEIPAELGMLSQLQVLRLSSNQLTGEIPASLTSLLNLRSFSLQNNSLTGEIPPGFGSLQGLASLVFTGNRLSGEIPRELGQLPNLQSLGLSWNRFTGEIPPELGALSNLRGLGVAGNELTGEIPPELGQLRLLTNLHVNGNQLTGEIPPELGALSELARLSLHNNQLTGEIPPELEALPNLRYLSLVNNPLTGCLPLALRSKLVVMRYGDGTPLGQIDLPLCEAERARVTLEPPLQQLVEDCSREGAVTGAGNNLGLVDDCAVLLEARDILAGRGSPPNWSAERPITHWEGIELGGEPRRVTVVEIAGGLEGRIPPGIGRLPELRHLGLADNSLSGGIPQQLGALTRLEMLRLNGNRLTGAIPGELGQLAYLHELNLSGNRLSGEIPSDLSRLQGLESGTHFSFQPVVVDLRDNLLEGSIPTALVELAEALWLALHLSGNQITGCIPLALGAEVIDRAALGLTYCQCASTLLLEREYLPTLTLEADGVPFMPRAITDVPGTYRLTFALVTHLPPGGRYLVGDRTRTGDGEIVVEIRELTSHSHLVIDPFTGEERSRSVVESPAHCSTMASALFDQIVAGAQIIPLVPSRDPDGVELLHVLQPVEGGRSYRIDHSTFLVVDAPEGMRLTLEHVRYNTVLLRDEKSGSLLTLDATTGSELSRQIVGEGDGAREVGGFFDQLAASVREYPPAPTCDDPTTAPDCTALLEAKALFVKSGRLNWSANVPIGAWRGVTVNRFTGRVVGLNLTQMGLGGRISPSLARLSWLESIDLYGNELTGGIPPELGSLTNLRELDLGENPLGGDIPPELGELTNLRALNLYVTELVGEIPEELGSLELLEELTIYGNYLEGCIPEALRGFDFIIHGNSNPNLRWCGGR